MIEAWHNGDSSTLELVTTEYEHPLIKKYELTGRNKKWLLNHNLLHKLEMTQKPISIAVGSAHLFGKTGLLKAFQNTGALQIRQIV